MVVSLATQMEQTVMVEGEVVAQARMVRPEMVVLETLLGLPQQGLALAAEVVAVMQPEATGHPDTVPSPTGAKTNGYHRNI